MQEEYPTFDSLNESSGSIEVLLALDESVVRKTDGAFEIETIRESAASVYSRHL